MSDASWLGYVRGFQTLVDADGNALARTKRLKVRGARAIAEQTSDGERESVIDARPNASLIRLEDRFLSGNNTSGMIGSLGWNLMGVGTPATSRVTGADGSGIRRLTTSSSANDISAIALGETTTRAVISPSKIEVMQWAVSTLGLADRSHFVGLTSDVADMVGPTRALGFLYDPDDSPNWQAWARNDDSGDQVESDIEVVAATTYVLTIHQHTAGSFRMYVDSTLVMTFTSDIPDAACNVAASTLTQAASASTFDLLYFGMSGPSGLISVP